LTIAIGCKSTQPNDAKKISDMDQYVELNNGARIPRLGLGTWKAPPEKTKEAVITAVKAGYRLIDCANDYDNEHVIGEALQELFKEGVVKREDLFIQAKLWNSNHRYSGGVEFLFQISTNKSCSTVALIYT
jgi:diketogulonate reductase-like aldo/keto reductase